jgi:hypothetical protein
MVRHWIFAIACVLLLLDFALSDTIRGKVKAIDNDANKLTLTVDGKEQIFEVAKDAKIWTTGAISEKGQPPPEILYVNIGALALDSDVTVTTEKKGDKELITSVKVERPTKSKGKKGGK